VVNLTVFQAIILGLIQGLTEFLPISSSGHLVILQHYLRIQEPGVIFEIVLHLGTLLAIFAVYGKDLIEIVYNIVTGIFELLGGRGFKRVFWMHPARKMALLIVIGSIPTALIGFTLESTFERLFNSIGVVGFTLLITGCLLWFAERIPQGQRSITNAEIWDAVLIGIAQGAAITPGISRSGLTIATGIFRGFDREMATKYSFLLSIPAVLGASLLKFSDISFAGKENLPPMIIGLFVSAVSGYLAIRFLIRMLKRGKLDVFAYYCWVLGIAIILSNVVFS
jgi:undecaprenyl-diphosphatase